MTLHRARSSRTAEWTTELRRRDRAWPASERCAVSRDGEPRAAAHMRDDLDRWIAKAPQLECDWELADGHLPAQPRRPGRAAVLAAHRRRPQPPGGGAAVVHDHVRSRQHLHQPAGAAVRAGAGGDHARDAGRLQGTRVDDFRDEEPGRILHEMRYGELTAFEERPHSPYYGAADATPLFVVLLDEYERWTGDRALVRDSSARPGQRCNWIDEYADLTGNGYVGYQRRNERDRPGEPVLEGLLGLDLLPRRHASRLPAGDLRAAGLRVRREGARRPAGTRSSGTTLPRRAARARGGRPQAAVQPRLLGRRRRLLSRWRSTPTVRRVDAQPPTSATCSGAASSTARRRPRVAGAPARAAALLGLGGPHAGRGRGPVQPDRLPRRHRVAVRQLVHRLGPAQLRFKAEAARIAAGILDAADYFDGRLPEAFGGYARELTKYPVQYPPRAARRRGRRARRCCSCARCSASNRSANTWSSTRRCRPASAGSSCWTSPAGGGTSTRSAAAWSTSDAADMISSATPPRKAFP